MSQERSTEGLEAGNTLWAVMPIGMKEYLSKMTVVFVIDQEKILVKSNGDSPFVYYVQNTFDSEKEALEVLVKTQTKRIERAVVDIGELLAERKISKDLLCTLQLN